MALGNNGELTSVQRETFRCYMQGFAKGSHSLTYETLRAEAMRYAEEERLDFNDRGFAEVVRFVNVTVSQIWEEWS